RSAAGDHVRRGGVVALPPPHRHRLPPGPGCRGAPHHGAQPLRPGDHDRGRAADGGWHNSLRRRRRVERATVIPVTPRSPVTEFDMQKKAVLAAIAVLTLTVTSVAALAENNGSISTEHGVTVLRGPTAGGQAAQTPTAADPRNTTPLSDAVV